MSPNEALCTAGEALFGSRWHTDLAKALEVNDRTVRRWAAGDDVPRPGVLVDVRRLIAEKQSQLEMLDQLLHHVGLAAAPT